MEAASDYWKPPFYLLEGEFTCWLVNARQVKNVPGRPKTDRQDAIWLAKLAERGMCRPSFMLVRAEIFLSVPPAGFEPATYRLGGGRSIP
jgi:transposase